MSTCAIVLTRNRKAMLVEGLRAVLGQTHPPDVVVVLDNASGDGTTEALHASGLLQDPRIHLHRSDTNLGSAGGYARAIDLALEHDTDWLWLMDDDAEPMPEALAMLLRAPAAADPGVVALCGPVVRPDGGVEVVHRCRLRRFSLPIAPAEYASGPVVDLSSFVGLLVRSEVVRRAGLPRADFFLAYDDAEWSLRLGEHGTIRLVPGSVMVHKEAMGGRSPTRRSRVWNRLLGADYASAPWDGYWRTLYGVRNFMAIRHRNGALPLPAFAGLTAVYVVKALLYDERPLRAVPWVVRFALRGRRGDFSSGPTPEQWAQIAAARR